MMTVKQQRAIGKEAQNQQMRRLILRMQAILDARRVAARCFPPVPAGLLDLELRRVALEIVQEMRRLEAAKGSAA